MRPRSLSSTLTARRARVLGATLLGLAALVALSPTRAQSRPTIALGATNDVTSSRESPAPRVPVDVGAAHQFVLAAYPDLLERPLIVTLTPTEGAMVVQVANAGPAMGRGRAAPAPILTATMRFDKAGRPETYAATGAFVEDTRNRALVRELAAHPEWTDADKDASLRRAGGPPTIGRMAPAVATLDAHPIRRFLGEVIVADASAFRWRGAVVPVKADGAPPKIRPGYAPVTASVMPVPPLAVTPAWVVEVTADPGRAETTRYRLEYEPFAGRLVGLVRQ